MSDGTLALFHKLIWRLGQPLTIKPVSEAVPVSDLFLWRNDDLDTVFELLCLSSIFSDNIRAETVRMVLFDHTGTQIATDAIRIKSHQRITLNMDPYTREFGPYGTMAFFHESVPEKFRSLRTHIAERGYTGFQPKHSRFKSYVHGNYDAICLKPDGSLQLLGGTSFLHRKYCVQYLFDSHIGYEVALVNPTRKEQKIKLSTFETDNVPVSESSIHLPPRGSRIIEYPPRLNSWTLTLESRMVMTRPIIFRRDQKMLDVFHG